MPVRKSKTAGAPAAGGLTVATWNINSVRLRAPNVARFCAEAAPDVLMLQEIKCQNDQFPAKALREMGYEHLHVCGQKGWHGVAIASKLPMTPLDDHGFCRERHARHAAAVIEGIEFHNFYVPAGGDIPDPEANEKFAHKLHFLDAMTAFFRKRKKKGADAPVLLAGDLNVAPREHDVWSHKQLLNVVSHTPPETTRLEALLNAYEFCDVARELIPEPEKLYSWWSYRNQDWRKSNRGRRLDHIWVSPVLREAALSGGRDGFSIFDSYRDGEKPSDHVPVVVRLKL